MKSLVLLLTIAIIANINVLAQLRIDYSHSNSKQAKEVEFIKNILNYNHLCKTKDSKRMALDSISNNEPQSTRGRVHFLYDSMGRDTCHISYEKYNYWKPWHLFEKTTLEYDKKNHITQYAEFKYHHIAKKWIPYRLSSIDYLYDSLTIIQKDYYYNTYTAQFDTSNISLIRLDSNQNIILLIDSTKGISGFEPSNKFSYSFDSQNRLNESMLMIWDSDSAIWQNSNRTNYSYFQGNIYQNIHSYFWTDSTQSWDTISRVDYSYNTLNNPTQITIYNYHIRKIITTNTYTYDQNQFPYELLSKEINTNNQLENYQLHRRINNQFGDDTIYYIYFWDTVNVQWIPVTKMQKQFDNKYDALDILYPFRFNKGDYYYKMILNESYYSFDTILNQWSNAGITYFYHYSIKEVLHIITSNSSVKTKVFPNPTHESLNFELPIEVKNAEIDIYDINGKHLRHEKLHNDFKIEVSNLEKGAYLFLIRSENRTFSGKFIVE